MLNLQLRGNVLNSLVNVHLCIFDVLLNQNWAHHFENGV